MIIGTDVDGVLLNWNKGFDSWMAQQGYTQVSSGQQFYGLESRYNIDGNAAFELVKRYNESAAAGFLEPYLDSQEVVTKWAQKGARFVAITAFGDEPYSVELRRMNLERIFGPNVFNDVIGIPIGSRKLKYLEPYRDEFAFWVEDHPRNAEDGAKVGIKSYLIATDQNDRAPVQPSVHKVPNWGAIYWDYHSP